MDINFSAEDLAFRDSTLVRLLTLGIRSMWGRPGTVLRDSARDVRVNSW